MAQLFKDRIIGGALEKFDISNFDSKLKVLVSWHDAYKSGVLQQKTESQSEQAFNNDIFVKVLDHLSFPSEFYTIDPKARTETSGQKPDAALGYFSPDETHVHAVCEIKDVNTSLDKPQQREGNLTPVQQAFKYKPQYSRCDFVLVTNFFEFRIYRDNQLDYEAFTLKDLVDSKDNYYQLRKFYYLLCRQNFIAKKGQSNTEKILSVIRIEEEEISKKFYTEYKQLRHELINNIQKNNPDKSATLAIEKAQKIIDRIVFVSFCEDLGLLPDNKLMEVVQWAENNSPFESGIWDTLVKFFAAVDHGSEKLGIPEGYNGELFKEDEDLDDLKIDDAITKKFVDFGRFSFSEDLTVNILGHIFEQSISDLESLKAAVDQAERTKKDSRRKKEGIFYTPEYIVNYIINNTVGRYLQEQEVLIKQKHGLKEDILDKTYKKRALIVYQEYQQVLQRIKVLDPACGSGAFLVKVFDYLLAENQRVAYVLRDLRGQAALLDQESFIKEILHNNIYGVDLNPESVEITKLSLWLKTAQKGKKLATLKDNIKCGNSLIDDRAIAKNHAFSWSENFKSIMENGGFDVLVGNPPYGAKLADDEKNYFLKKYDEIITGEINTYTLFFLKISELLKQNSLAGFIVPEGWMVNKSMHALRNHILKTLRIEEIALLRKNIFEDAPDVIPTIAIFSNKKDFSKDVTIKRIGFDTRKEEVRNLHWKDQKKLDQQAWKNESYSIFTVNQSAALVPLYIRMKNNCDLLSNPNLKRAERHYYISDGIYKTKLIPLLQNNGEYPVYTQAEEVQRYYAKPPQSFLSSETFQKLPEVESKKYANETIAIHAIKKPNAKNRISGSFFSNSNQKQFTIFSNNFLVLKNISGKYDPLFILLLLNSKLLNTYYTDHYIQVNIEAYTVGSLPIPNVLKEDQIPFIKEAELMMTINEQFQDTLRNSLRLLKHEYQLNKFNKKLQSFYELDFDDFVLVLNVKAMDLNKKKDLLSYFEITKMQLLNLKSKVIEQDAKINDMVYKLYGLSDEEIQTVENSQSSSNVNSK